MLENSKHWRLYLLVWQEFESAETGVAREDEQACKLSETEIDCHHEVASA